MKTISAPIFFLSAIYCGLFTLTSLKQQTQSTAIPERQQGIDIYVMSEPTRPYEIIKTQSWTGWTCKESINTPINKAAKFEGAQGVIIYFPTSDKYSIIKYKD